MTKKEKFMMFVYLGAIARDLGRDTNSSQGVVQYAARIPERAIPENVWNASQVFLNFMDGRTRPFNWMC
jgi:hypothetical protein